MPAPATRAVLNRLISVAAQVVVAMVLILGAAAWVSRAGRQAEQAALPPGWLIIRPPDEVSCLAFYDGAVWAGGVDGLSVIDRPTGKPLAPPAGMPETGYVHSLLATSTGELLIGAEAGLIVRQDQTWRVVAPDAATGCGRVLGLLEANTGEILLGVNGGVSTYDGTTINPIDLGAIKPHQIDVLYQDRQGTIWAGCSAAGHGLLLQCNAGLWSESTTADQLPHPSVNAFAEDSMGVLWVGTGFAGNGGAACQTAGTWQAPAGPEQLNTCKVRSLYRDSRGRLWFGLEYDGAIIYDQGSWRVLNPADGLAGKEVKTVLEDSDSVYWIGTDRGLSRLILN